MYVTEIYVKRHVSITKPRPKINEHKENNNISNNNNKDKNRNFFLNVSIRAATTFLSI